ncbi:ribD C-terminal domain protein [Mycobacterium xenopi 4042]|uniref:RibD C-terminal domain protein n=1 Tax=Mycobacterium xenopi 4042 TaxID=1299334 RepID=X7YP76_MYCXE|nr:ribD C-terminal domain protein [Mycobacterium xenopi 4042]
MQPLRQDPAVRGCPARRRYRHGGVRGCRPEPRRRRRRSPAAAAGVHVVPGVQADLVAAGPLREWLHKQRTGLPHVTWKYATSIDGRSAAADGSSQWITSEAARADLHRRRAAADAIVVGTGTVLTDDPALTARLADGTLAERQPLRVVVGKREIPSEAQVLNDDSRTMVIRTHDPHEVLKALSDRTDVLLEGGRRSRAPSCAPGHRPHPGLCRADPLGGRSPRSTTSGCRASPGPCAGGLTGCSGSARTCC